MIFVIGQEVYWDDPDNGAASGLYKIEKVIDDESVLISNKYSEAEVPLHELMHLDDLYACHECGSLDIEEMMWVTVNKRHNIITDSANDDKYYCNQCEEIYNKYPLNVGLNIKKFKSYEQHND